MNAIADIQILSRHAFSSRRKVPCPDSSGMTPSPAEQTALKRVKSLSYWKGPVSPERVPGGLTNINFRVRKDGESTFVRVGDDIPVHHIMRFNERTASEAAFWVFHVIRDYAHTLERANSKHASRLPELIDIANELELAVGPVDFVFGHNDLLPGNFIDDGDRLWLIDWDYAGYNSPLFDLANLSSNCQFDRDQEDWLLHAYFGRAVDERLQASYRAMKCASLLREAMWSMTSEIFSTLDFDYAAYTADYMDRFARAYATYRTSPA